MKNSVNDKIFNYMFNALWKNRPSPAGPGKMRQNIVILEDGVYNIRIVRSIPALFHSERL